ELRRHDLAQRQRTKIATDDRRNTPRKFVVEFAKPTADNGFFAFDGGDGEIFVMKIEYRFDHVRKRAVADIVKQCRAPNGDAVRVADLVFGRKFRKYARSKVHCAER